MNTLLEKKPKKYSVIIAYIGSLKLRTFILVLTFAGSAMGQDKLEQMISDDVISGARYEQTQTAQEIKKQLSVGQLSHVQYEAESIEIEQMPEINLVALNSKKKYQKKLAMK